jgi:hypothetical protein
MGKFRINLNVRAWSLERKLSALFLLSMLVLGAYNAIRDSEWGRFRKAKSTDKIPAWTEFLSKAEDDEHIAFARSRIERLKEQDLWRNARGTHSPGLLQSYIQAYPDGEFAGQARAQYTELAQAHWIVVRDTPTAKTLQTFAAEYGASQWADSAKVLFAELAEQAFEEIAQSKLEVQLDMFADTWKGTEAAKRATKRKQDLWNSFDWVKKTNTKAAYERFIERNPNSPEVSFCKRRLIDLEVDQALLDRDKLGELPPMSRMSSGATTRTSISVKNDTRYTLDVLYSGPSSDRLTVSPGAAGKIALSNGTYRVLASVRASNVSQYYGNESLNGGVYEVTYYITTY